MKEDFLHYIWKYKLFNSSGLLSQNEEDIQLVNFGIHNTDAGPDFFNGKVKIGKTTWAGNIEIHINSSDWNRHNHELDKAYDNVILHVVYHNDKEIYDKNGNAIPTLALKGLIDEKLIDKYIFLTQSKDWIPCEKQIGVVDNFVIQNWLHRLSIERLERKSQEIEDTLKLNKNNWEETFYQYLFKYFGLKVNALPFELLAKNTALKITGKHMKIESVEALYFGQAGFLSEKLNDDYYDALRKEYQFLQSKFKLQAIDKTLWKFLRLRPSNFPTIRISQLANLFSQNPRIFSKILAANSIKEIEKLFEVKASSYWDNHYQFGKLGKTAKVKKLGKPTIYNLIINVIVPLLFVYSKFNKVESLDQKVLNYLELLPAENNSIIKRWNNIGVKAINSLQTQSLLELKNNYCSQKKCLNCSIGNNLLKHD